MKLVSLSNNEAAPSGFTHKWIITHEDLTAAATTETLQLADNITAGYLVQEAAFRVVTGFTGGSLSTMVIDVGYDLASGSDDADAFIDNVNVFAAGGGDGNGAVFATLRTGYYFAEGASVEVLFTGSHNVGTATAGEVHIYLRMIDLAAL